MSCSSATTTGYQIAAAIRNTVYTTADVAATVWPTATASSAATLHTAILTCTSPAALSSISSALRSAAQRTCAEADHTTESPTPHAS